MSSDPDIIPHGLEQARYALTSIIGMTNAHLRPRTLTRGLKQRAMGRLRQLEMIVRRLLVLMALALTLPAVRQRTGHTLAAPLPDGVEMISFPTPRRFALSAPCMGPAWDGDGFAMVSGRVCGPVPAAPFLARVSALYKVLAAPEAHAKRLARSLARQRQRGEPRPVALPMASAYRLRPELGLIATLLPGLLRTAFETWESSG